MGILSLGLELGRLHADTDPDDVDNTQLFNGWFMAQSAPDGKKKLNNTEGAEGMPITELIEIAYRVCNNRGNRDKKENQS